MWHNLTAWRTLAWTVAACLGFSGAQADEIRVLAAASLKTALDAAIVGFETQGQHRVTVSYAGSSALARQIQHGAPADIFLSANIAWVKVLDDEGLVARQRPLVSNRLALIGSPDAPDIVLRPDVDLASHLESGPLAMALVQAVPAGIYGKQALVHLGIWDSVAARVAQTDNVRAALRLVSSGAAPLGIVYATDARADPAVRVLAVFPEASHDPILYPAALLRDARPGAVALWTYLTGPALPVFFEYGFLPADVPQ